MYHVHGRLSDSSGAAMKRRTRRLFVCVFVVVIVYVVFIQFIITGRSSSTDSHGQFIDQSLNDVNDETTLGFDAGAARTLVMLTYQRSGSSFIGQMFNVNPAAFYLFEPLDSLYVAMYAINHGWSVPSDISSYWNGSARMIPEVEVRAVAEFIQHVSSCDVDWLPTETLTHNFWWIHRHNTLTLADYVQCIRSRNLTYPACEQHNRWPCGRRFGAVDESRNTLCRRTLWRGRYYEPGDVNETEPELDVAEYQRCLSRLRADVDASCAFLLRTACIEHRLRVIKATRATMASVEHLLRTSPDRNLRVLHSLRDPRAVALSRVQQGDPLLGKFASVVLDSRRDEAVVREARMYCRAAAADVQIRRRLEVSYPGRVLTVRYEEAAGDLRRHVDQLYRFMGEASAPADVAAWAAKNAEMSRSRLSAWRAKMSVALSDRVLAECVELCESIGCT